MEAKSRNNMYFIEYTVTKPAQEQKHLMSAVALGFNGRYALFEEFCCHGLHLMPQRSCRMQAQ